MPSLESAGTEAVRDGPAGEASLAGQPGDGHPSHPSQRFSEEAILKFLNFCFYFFFKFLKNISRLSKCVTVALALLKPSKTIGFLRSHDAKCVTVVTGKLACATVTHFGSVGGGGGGGCGVCRCSQSVQLSHRRVSQ